MHSSTPEAPGRSRHPLAPVGLLATIRPWLWLIIAATVLGGVISFVIALVTPPTYVGRVTLLISPPAGGTTISLGDVEVTQALAPTFAELATTTPLLDKVIADTGITVDRVALAKAITTHVPTGTSLIDIEVANRDAGTAAALANAIAEALRAYGADGSGQVLGLTLTVVDPAVVPTSREGFGIPVQTALGAAIALFLSISLAFFIENIGRGIRGVGRRLPISGGPSESSHAHRVGAGDADDATPVGVSAVEAISGDEELPPANRPDKAAAHGATIPVDDLEGRLAGDVDPTARVRTVKKSAAAPK